MRLPARKYLIPAVFIALLIGVVLVLVFAWVGSRSGRFDIEPSLSDPGNDLEIAEEGRALVVPNWDVRFAVPEGWHAEATESRNDYILRPDINPRYCGIQVTKSMNSGGESATAFLNRYDLGKVLDSSGTDREQRLIEVAGTEAAYFGWIDEKIVRHRVAYIPYSTNHLYSIIYREDASSMGLERQAKPCIWDFDTFIEEGITLGP